MYRIRLAVLECMLLACLVLLIAPLALADKQAGPGTHWVVYPGGDGPGAGKHVVLIAGDDEYRSEEVAPMLGKILSVHHGFKCTILWSQDPNTGEITPKQKDNIPGMHTLADADLIIIGLRFRNLPDEDMKHFEDYLKAGKPIIGYRTSTHGFKIDDKNATYHRYDWKSEVPGWENGFGQRILGQGWSGHHGSKKGQGVRGVIPESAKEHAIVRGIEAGTFWGPTHNYTVDIDQMEQRGNTTIALGELMDGQSSDSPPTRRTAKNDPMMPLAWVRTYQIEDGKPGRAFASTMGAAKDLAQEGSRRLFVNAAYWALGMEDAIPESGTKVDLVGSYKPSDKGMKEWVRGKKPSDYALAD